jgi:hypothetical protein
LRPGTVTLGEQTRIGYGLPDALVALGWSMMIGDRRALQQAMPPLAGMPGIGLGALPSMSDGGFGQLGLGVLSGGPGGVPFTPGGLRYNW